MSRDANAFLRAMSDYKNARPHRVIALRKCIGKRRYATLRLAKIGLVEAACNLGKTMYLYYCTECLGYHAATSKDK